jgi:hypothetical protein
MMRVRRNLVMVVLTCAWLSSFAHSQPATSAAVVLEHANRYVAEFVEQFSEVKCSEHVTQAKLAKSGKVDYSEDSVFDYLVIMQGGEGDLMLSESRLQVKEAKHSKSLPLLVTNGFSTIFLIFHPYYLDSFTFTAAGEEELGGRRYAKVRFDHILGARTPIALAVRGREYPLELSGIAWIDPATGAISRIQSGLVAPMLDIGLKEFRTEVQYAKSGLTSIDEKYEFPVVAVVDVETIRQQWRNTHKFTDYKRFSVSTDVELAEKK